MRTAYLGTSDFAATVLERLAGSAHRPALVITRPDRPKGRGRTLTRPPVAETADRLGLPVIQPERVGDPAVIDRLGELGLDALCLCAYGAVIREPLLSLHPILNVHPSLLPRWRGAAPVERAIMAGDAETGVSIMRLTEGLDAGPVSLQAATPIGPGETYGSLAPRLAALGGELLERALGEAPPFVEQDEAAATYAEKLTAEDRRIDPARPAVELARIVRALTPHIGAQIPLADGAPLGVTAAHAEAAPLDSAEMVGAAATGADGLELGGELPRLRCADGSALVLDRVKPAGKREMAAADWLRGLRR